jgi:superoxide reductase
MKLVKCEKCGAMVEVMVDCTCEGCGIQCCGETMKEVKANSVDAANEKHVPFVQIDGDAVEVRIGEVPHPMEEKHYIEWVAAEYSDSFVKYYLKPGEQPECAFDYEKGMTVYAYCNLHGLWKKEL